MITKKEEFDKSTKVTKAVKTESEKPLVSIIVPAYNVDGFVKQCIDSLLRQTYKNIEIICIDDGSTDNTLPILKFLENKDSRVILIQQKHSGVSAARNMGMERAKGKYISFVDADDFMQENSYEILVEVAEKNKLDLIMFGANVIGDAPELVFQKLNTRYKYYKKGTSENIIFDEESARPFIWQHFIRRELFEIEEKIRFHEELKIGEGQLCQFEYVPRAESVMVIEDRLYNFRYGRDGSLIQLYENKPEEAFEAGILLFSKVVESWKQRKLFDRNEDQLITWIVDYAYQSLSHTPWEARPKLARKVLSIISQYDIKEYCIAWYEKEHLAYLKAVAEIEEKQGNVKKQIKKIKVKKISDDNKPMVSVIVPTYNVGDYIKQCVDSLLEQTYKDIEVICIDDGSTDDTLSILKFLEQKDDRLILIQQEHLGVSAARNKGLERARGKYISFVDSDDFMQWNSFEILVNVAESNNLDLIIFGANAVGDAPEWIQKKLNTRYKYYSKGTAENIIFDEESARPFLWLHFIRRELFERGEKIRFNESMELGEDQLCQFEYVPRAESVMVIEDKLYNYRIGRNCSLMQLYEKQQMKKFESHILLISNVIESWRKNDLLDRKEDQLITWIVNLTYWSLIYFPPVFQPKLAKRVVDLIARYELKDYCIAWWEREHLDYIKEMADKEIDENEEKEKLEAQMNQEIYQIQEILKSRAFKLGRFMTPKKERLNLAIFEEYL